MLDENSILDKLRRSWSAGSSSLWSEENPARGQCGVTSIVIQKIYGGEIRKTKTPDGQWHFYNIIDNCRYDFTSEQFFSGIEYLDILSSPKEAFKGTNANQISYLMNEFSKNLNRKEE